ncbi:MAG: phage shock protein PspA [Pseudomonadota bacterium]
MGVFSRLSDIINSNINAMLDRAEDPEKIVRLIIQEMEDTLVEVRSRAARGIADRKEVERRKADFVQRTKDWEAKAELAIEKGRDDLARGAISARRKAQDMIDLLDGELQAIADTMAKTNGDLEKLQSKLKEAKARQRSMELRHGAASDAVSVNRQVHDGRIDDALARFDRYESRVNELEAEAESWTIGTKRTLEQEFADLEVEDAVNAELTALKNRLASRS